MFKSKKEKLEKEILKEEKNNIEIPEHEPGEDINDDEEIINNEPEVKISELEKQVQYFKDQYLRKAADFENYKKRTETEVSGVYRYANENLMYELLPVLDDFERIKKVWDEKHDIETLKKGIEIIFDKFKSVLKKQGLKEIESIGKPFDVNQHEAIMQLESKDVDPNIVTEVAEKGYFLKDKILRHAKVIVSKLPDEESIDE